MLNGGADGSSGFSMFKQISIDPNLNDSSLFATSLVPLQMFTVIEGVKKILWQNPRPGSTRYCRPIRLNFEKETTELILSEARRVEKAIAELNCFLVELAGLIIEVIYSMHMTMNDGKVCNAIANQKCTQACYLCRATSKILNDMEKLKSLIPGIDPKLYKLGMSSLHAWIRTYEYLLHLGYKIEVYTERKQKPPKKPVQKPAGKGKGRGQRKGKEQEKEEGQERLSEEEKQKVEERKREIQRKFKIRTGLNVDKPKQGFGNTNDGNTARAFFSNAKVTSEITGVDQDIIERFGNILGALSSGFEIDPDAYENYCMELAAKCFELYGWYVMPPTVHKVLFHGGDILKAAPLPKGSREDCNLDLLHFCLTASDPLITSMRKLPRKSSASRPFSPGVLKLLKSPDLGFVPIEEELSDAEDDENS